MPFLELADNPDLEDNPRELSTSLLIGSGSQATWRLANMDLAARHFTVSVDGQGHGRVVPATPQNVVILNGQQVAPKGADLQFGDSIGAGSARFVFLGDRNDRRPTATPTTPGFLIDVGQKKAYQLKRRVVQIGREIGCNIVLRDPTVSRFHADIRSEGGEHVVYSIGSAGTKVNGEPSTAPTVLKEGDQLQIGETIFTFTRGALPSGVRQADFEDHSDDALNRRSTQLHMDAVTGDTAKVSERKPLTWILSGALIIAIAALLWVLMH
ncbi:MAG: FHA domain-containing protein [Gemmatimonadota bacterium]|nr:FHA domain-containing protein [Gemmatimonadota bacterium]